MTVPSQLHAVWKSRIAADQAVVDDATTQLLATRHEYQLAEDALALAAAKVEYLKADVNLLEQRQSAAMEQLDRSRAASLRIAVSNLPDDVLRCIFICCAELPDAQWLELGQGSFNYDRSKLPFALAAVCTRWRRVALGSGGLWAYISLPSELQEGHSRDSHLHRIELLLSRSRNSPLDVLLDMRENDWDATDENNKWVRHMIFCVGRHVDRWSRVKIVFSNLDPRDLADVFRAPMPRLEHLSFVGPDSEDWRGTESLFLPYVPIIQELHLSFTGIAISPFHAGFPSLVSLTVADDMTPEILQRVLELSRATLQVLDLDVDFNITSSASLSLPSLHTLNLRCELFFVTSEGTIALNAPSLRSLTLWVSPPFNPSEADNLSALFESVSSTVTALTLYGEVDSAFVDTCGALLRNLSHVTFATHLESCTVDDQFFVALSKHIPSVWPRLQSIVLDHARIAPPNGDGIVQLLTARNALSNSEPTLLSREAHVSERPCRIREVRLAKDAPEWAVAEVNRLLNTTT
ncbi:hypothetical protein EXIGLDRAFT_833646 [Exidia glandulosa HHB12029]|uniref:Uncharacterized protein n=1 Tax=Exidia glandulosa HHB12029 TaxID=1314781 RepID=A0A165KIT9_EXIGL|nr:hypothetical protein EXIGLDRAFT_833646 [Exidia glandulosa HHB12029]